MAWEIDRTICTELYPIKLVGGFIALDQDEAIYQSPCSARSAIPPMRGFNGNLGSGCIGAELLSEPQFPFGEI